MKVGITSGECLNEILEKIYPKDTFVPFNEAMIEGKSSYPFLSSESILERSAVHGVTLIEYSKKLEKMRNLIEHIKEVDELVMWFGDEPFCRANRAYILTLLKEIGYTGKLTLNIVVEETGEIVSTQILS